MIDETEARARIALADKLLEDYQCELMPVLEYLKEQFCAEFSVDPVAVHPAFGCWEDGIDTICLHSDGGVGPDFGSAAYPAWHDRVTDFEDKWSTERIRVKVW